MTGVQTCALPIYLDPDSGIGPGPRAKIKAAADYLAVAPKVVAVARALALGPPVTALPRTPADPDAVLGLAQRWNLEGPAQRLVAALQG